MVKVITRTFVITCIANLRPAFSYQAKVKYLILHTQGFHASMQVCFEANFNYWFKLPASIFIFSILVVIEVPSCLNYCNGAKAMLPFSCARTICLLSEGQKCVFTKGDRIFTVFPFLVALFATRGSKNSRYNWLCLNSMISSSVPHLNRT